MYLASVDVSFLDPRSNEALAADVEAVGEGLGGGRAVGIV